MKLFKQLIVLAVTSTLAVSAQAITTTTTMNVTMTNIANITVSATDMVFGNVPITGIAILPNTSASITVNGTNGTNYTVSIDGGLTPGAAGTCRKMTGAGGIRTYDLFSNSGLTTRWGDSDFANTCAGATLNGGASVAGTADGTDQVLTVYAKAALNGGTLGALSDTLTITVTY